MRTGIWFCTAALLVLSLSIIATGCNDTGAPPGDTPHLGTVEPQSDTPDQPDETVIPGSGPVPDDRLMPEDFTYQGAFRLPDEFAWGALGLSYYPAGDGGNGSLFVTGFQGLLDQSYEPCYEGSQGCNAYFGEVSIPSPATAPHWEDLPLASFVQEMAVFDGGLVQTVHEAYSFVSGIAYVPRQGSQAIDKIYGSLNEWYPEGSFGDASFPTIWFSDPDGSNARGVFHVGPDAPPFHGIKMGAYLFTVPQTYAD
ncbi:MAG: hypothetical protein PVJ07_04300, partial [Anaerolineales bacterium]